MNLMSNFLYSVNQGIKGVFKNKTMSFISIISVTASLIILGIITSIVLNTNQFIKATEYEINEIRVSIKDNLDKSSLDNIKTDLSNIKGIKNIEFKDKETMLDEMKSSWGEDSYLLEGLENPLDDCYIVTLENSENIDSVSSKIYALDNIKNVEYHKDVVDNTLKNMPDNDIFNKLAEFFKIIGDTTRTKILFALDKNEMCVCDIANVLGMSKSSISHQLGTLRRSGIVKCRKSGKEVFYMLDDEHVQKVFEVGLEHIGHRK